MPVKDTAIEQVIELLRVTPLCDGLRDEELAELAGQLRLRSFMPGETLALSGEPVKEFWVVVDGEIEAYLTDVRGRESQLGVVRKGETIGDVSIIENTLRPIRLTAKTHGALLTTSSDVPLLGDGVFAREEVPIENMAMQASFTGQLYR